MAIPIFQSRELARRLNINLARWKRWSREFLPPDPLAGIRSGYARQYYLDDAFRVYLGGYLVSHLHLGVPDARQVLTDLTPWMKAEGLGFDLRGQLKNGQGASACEILLQHVPGGFAYRVRKCLERRLSDPGPPPIWDERWREDVIETASGARPPADDGAWRRTIRISFLLNEFQTLVKNSRAAGNSRPEP
ncbi:MAG TPA: hypothetical protein ENF48_02270 [Desulfobacteraceae bacterium]|nr:hypothetical protein [Deltaproteobacteria bacterium]MBW2356572.1 hypothetical protein [Deltaproteobacteria bacterium]HDI59177.1 hypothetical protein [Desulfobacteraceae bacterium]